MNLKKITAIMIGAVMAVSMAVPAMADDKVETVTDGKLTVATSPDFAPYEFYSIDEDGNPTLSGFDMDLAQYIADKMGLEPDGPMTTITSPLLIFAVTPSSALIAPL